MSRINSTYDENDPLVGVEVEEATNSWHSTASLIVCAMAGVGCVSLYDV